ncbi:Hypothetical Protein OBI_RACECAR_66 [Arthrobacter phage Racecar]|nr:hypothetical protein PBI_RACECAR_148 [Arthrobacter phage Racecar]QFG12822.1 hypothetical protein PBI_MIMI_145 [Arthrobacter phage Mimi]
MAIKTVTFMSTLMHYSKEVGRAKREGDPEKIAQAEAKLKEYEQLVLDSDEMRVDIPSFRPN